MLMYRFGILVAFWMQVFGRWRIRIFQQEKLFKFMFVDIIYISKRNYQSNENRHYNSSRSQCFVLPNAPHICAVLV